MVSEAKVKEMIRDLFEEEALMIGGLLPFHSVDDEFIWRLLKGLDVVRSGVIRQLNGSPAVLTYGKRLKKLALKPHPAIEDFLLKLRRM